MTEDKFGVLRRTVECAAGSSVIVSREDVRALLEDVDHLSKELWDVCSELRKTRALVRKLFPLSLADIELLRESLEKGP